MKGLSLKHLISIDIGSFNTKIAVGGFEKGRLNIDKMFAFDTNQGSMMDGKLISVDGKSDALRSSIVQALNDHKVRNKNTIFTVQSTSIIRRDLDIPHVKQNEMESMIRFEIEQYLPIDLNEYIIEYKVLEEKQDNKLRILIAALPKEIAEDYLEITHKMNLEPKALDINSNAVSKLFGIKQQINDHAYNLENTAAFIDMGCSNINISILSKGLFQFSRLIPTGGKELTSAIAEAYGMTMEEAEKKKRSSINLNNGAGFHDDAVLDEMVRNIVFRWTEEIQRVFQFYKTRNANNDINEVYIYGGTSNLRGIAEYMENTWNLPTRKIKSLSSVTFGKDMDDIGLEYYLNTIGAIIRK